MRRQASPGPDDTTAAPVAASQTALRILWVVGAYFVFGKLGLLLAIPPGYATAVWPASGLALAAGLLWGYRIWPGILLGSILVNIATSWDSSTVALAARSLALATAIGFGAAAQAMAGTWLIRRRVGIANIFTQEADVIRLLMLGGPLSCAINACIGVGSLWAAGLIPAPNVLFNIWTWWVGDSIGVLIFTPLICAWSLRPRGRWLRQQIALSLPMGIVFAAVVALFFYVSSGEQRRLSTEFHNRAGDYAAELQKVVDANLDLLGALRSFYAASDHVSRAEFSTFVGGVIDHYPAIQTVGWAPRVEPGNLTSFVEAMRQEGLADYQVFDRNADHQRIPIANRAEYFPLAYLVPDRGNEAARGYDVTSETLRRAAVDRALRSGRAAVTTRIRLVQDESGGAGVILYLPIYRNGDPAQGPVLGLASIAMRVDQLALTALGDRPLLGLQARILDGPSDGSTELWNLGASKPTATSKIAEAVSLPIRVADRSWTLQFLLPADYLVAHRSWQAWGLLAVGLSLTALLGMLLLVLLARQSKVEELVASRTDELLQAEQRRAAAQAQLSSYAADLERSNKELEQFAYVASHDLQAPLRGILSFSHLLKQRYVGKPLEGKGEEFIQHIELSARHMEALIRDLLAFSRVGRHDRRHEVVDCEEVLAQVLTQIAGIAEPRNASISHEPLPRVRGSRVEIFQLFQNLIVNGLKFQPGEQPRIHIFAAREGSVWRVSIQDFGIGIAPQHQERIFQMFQRLHAGAAFEGTGIGLAICQKIVAAHGGRIWVESSPGQGAIFNFTLPAAEGGDDPSVAGSAGVRDAIKSESLPPAPANRA